MTDAIPGLVVVGIWLSCIAAWFTHLFWFFALITTDGASGGQVFFFIVAALIAPIGCLHGFWLWFT